MENLAAYEAFLQATDLIMAARYLPDREKEIKLNNARRLLERAIEQGSSFVDAYIKLGGIYVDNLFQWNLRDHVERAYSHLETGYTLVEKALLDDPGNKNALRLKGSYYQKIGNHQEAEKYIEASFEDRNRSFGDYEWEAFSYLEYDNYYPGIKSYLKYLELKPPDMDVPAYLLYEVFRAFNESGFFELARQHAEQRLALTRDYNTFYYQIQRFVLVVF